MHWLEFSETTRFLPVWLHNPRPISLFAQRYSLDDILYGLFRSMQLLLDSITSQKISQDFTKAQKLTYNWFRGVHLSICSAVFFVIHCFDLRSFDIGRFQSETLSDVTISKKSYHLQSFGGKVFTWQVLLGQDFIEASSPTKISPRRFHLLKCSALVLILSNSV